MGASKSAGLDGITILPTLLGNSDQPPRNPMVWAFVEYSGQVAVRLGDWKVIQGNGFAGSLEKAGIYLTPAQALFAEATKNER